MPEKIDAVLEACGGFGRYQLVQASLAALGTFSACFPFLVTVFQSLTPDHRCRLSTWEDNSYLPYNDSHNASIYEFIPVGDDGQLDSCHMYSTINQTNSSCSSYVFDKKELWGVSLNERFGLVCDKVGYNTVVKLSFTLGLVIGAVIIGALSDRFGRRPAMLLCMFGQSLLGIVAAFSPNIYMFAALRFLIGLFAVGGPLLAHCMAIEVTVPRRRPQTVAYKSGYWPVGQIILALMAYYIQDWNWLQLASSIPGLLSAIIQFFFLNETPHYLVTKKKDKEAVKLFYKMASMNRISPPEILKEGGNAFQSTEVQEKLISVLKSPTLVKRSLVFFLLWFIAGLSFYGLNFNLGNLTGSVYINTLIYGVSELSVSILIAFSHQTGRRVPAIICFLIGGVTLILSAILSVLLNQEKFGVVIIVIAAIGKWTATAVFLYDYLWSSEVFPSTLRVSLVGISSTCSRIGTLLSPIVVDLYLFVDTPLKSGLGPMILGVAMLVGGVLAFYPPETKGQKIPETIGDANRFMTADDRQREDAEEEKSLTGNADDMEMKMSVNT